MTRFAGKSVIITGAGAGIGQAVAAGFVRDGAEVFAIGRSSEGLVQTRALCSGPGTLHAVQCDVTDAAGLENHFLEIIRQTGHVDLLVNNAAVQPRKLLADTNPDDWKRDVDINLGGVAFACRAAIRQFPRELPAVILNVGSFAYLGPEPQGTLYCATKAAVSAFTRALAVELAASGSALIVNEWIPGVFRTRMSGQTGEDPALAYERLVSAWSSSMNAPGGRRFEGGREVLPPRSLASRILSRLRLRR